MNNGENRTKGIFLGALDIASGPDRDAYINEQCAGNATLRREVLALLAEHQQVGSFLEPTNLPYTSARTVDEGVGTVIGPYKLLQQIGEGGMGVVFMAQQYRPVQRMVALKIIKPGMDTRQVVARFEAERQALALMDHPNIAKVLDAATTASGLPYFVMELVKGVPITQYCDEHHLAPRQRLELFVPVCQAVQHAHQKGIIHRDLKPSNVLIAQYDGQPVPKIIDFGVAKATGPRLTERTMFTEFGAIVGTLEYMSPEQAEMNQLDIDTRSDIYSLGVLLYELLTSTTPFEKKRLRSAAFDEMLRIIREEEPPKPSTRVSTTQHLPSIAANRSLEPKKLTGLLRGELDWIVMKCLEKDRNRRYETANGLSQDLQRYLSDEPVQACPPSATYRLRKFVRRNKRVMASAVLLGVTLLVVAVSVAGSVGWVARDRANRQAVVDQQTLAALDEADRAYREDKLPEATAAVKQAAGLWASGGGNEPLALRLQQWQTDLEMVNRLEEIRISKAVVKDNHFDSAPADPAYQDAFKKYGLDLDQLEPEQAAVRIRESAIQPHLIAALDDWTIVKIANDREHFKRLLETARRADPDPWRNRMRDAVERRDKETLKKLSEDESIGKQPQSTIALLCNALNELKEDDAVAIGIMRKAQRQHPNDFWLNTYLGLLLTTDETLAYRMAAVALRPENPGARVNLGVTLANSGRLEEGMAEYQRAIDFAPEFALARLNIANSLADQGKADEADQAAQETARLNPNSATAQWMIGNYYARRKNLPSAESAFREAIRIHPDYAEAYDRLTDILIDQKKSQDAEQVQRQAIEREPKNASHHAFLGRTLREQGKWAEAIAADEEAVRLGPEISWVHCELGNTLRICTVDELRDLDRAKSLALRAAEIDPRSGWAHQLVGEIARDQKQWKEAIPALEKSIELEPDNAWRKAELARILTNCPDLALRNPQRAIELAKKATQLEPAHYQHWEALGWAQYRAGLWQESIESLEKSGNMMEGRSRGGNAWHWFFIAMDHWQLGNHDEARKWFRKAISNQQFRFPDVAEIAIFHAEAAQLLGLPGPVTELVKKCLTAAEQQKWDEAAETCLHALEWLPIESFSMSARKKLCFDAAHYDELFDRLVAIRPDDVDLRVARGRYFAVQGDWQRAIAEYRSVESQLPPVSESHEYACLLLLSRDQAGFEQFLRKYAETNRETTDQDIRAELAVTASLAPQTVVSPTQTVTWALASTEENPPNWRLAALALTHCRAGQFDDAVKVANDLKEKKLSLGLTVEYWLIMALAAHGQANASEAERCLQEAQRARAELPVGETYNPKILPMPELLSIEVLSREAEELISPQSTASAAPP